MPADLDGHGTALTGFLLAVLFYGLRILDPDEVRGPFRSDLRVPDSQVVFRRVVQRDVRAAGLVPVAAAWPQFDKQVIDRFIDALAALVRGVARIDDLIDRY